MVLRENIRTSELDRFTNCDPEQITSSLNLFNNKIRKIIPQIVIIISFFLLSSSPKRAALLRLTFV